MKILGISSKANTANINNKATVPFWGLKINAQPKKDMIAFSGTLRHGFSGKKEAFEYYKSIAEKVNQSLADEDELTAFELLGYNVESDFDTDKITINGDFKPYFKAVAPCARTGFYVSYEEVGIDEEKLLANVEKITGTRYPSLTFTPAEDFIVDKNVQYVGPSAANVDALLSKRANVVKQAINDEDYEKALGILGFQSVSDEEGNITIKGNYSAQLLDCESGIKTLKDYGIDENALLSKVVKIEGRAEFQKGFSPDHFIEADYYSTVNSFLFFDDARRIAQEFVKHDTKFNEKIQKVIDAIKTGDTLTALLELGHDAAKDEDGKITINGNLNSTYEYNNAGISLLLHYFDYGIDTEDLLKDVKHVTGDVSVSGTSLKKFDKGLTVDGIVYTQGNFDERPLFEDFLPEEAISELYDGISPEVIKQFIKYGALTPELKTMRNTYFSDIKGKNKEFLDGIMSRRDEILTSSELAKKYFISDVILNNALRKGTLHPYGITFGDKSLYYEKASDYLFDTTDPNNQEVLKKFEAQGKKRMREANPLNISGMPRNNFSASCIRNSVGKEWYDADIKHYPAKALEVLGYGSKADIMANCKLRKNAYELKRYFLTRDYYDISNAEVMDILFNARKNNPALVKISTLVKLLGENKDEFAAAVIADKINTITINPYRLTSMNDFCIDISDEKNLAFLQTIDNNDFQTWLMNKLAETKAYRSENQAELELFKTQKPPTQQERKLAIDAQLDSIAQQRKAQAQKEKLEIKRQKRIRNRALSLRNSIAWVLCPNTLQIKKEKSNEHVKDIFAKHKELKQINNELLAGEITYEEAHTRIKALNLSAKDEITVLTYHKTCWELAGTQEWSDALHQAKEFMEIYNTQGIDAIEDEVVKNRIIRWEEEHKAM